MVYLNNLSLLDMHASWWISFIYPIHHNRIRTQDFIEENIIPYHSTKKPMACLDNPRCSFCWTKYWFDFYNDALNWLKFLYIVQFKFKNMVDINKIIQLELIRKIYHCFYPTLTLTYATNENGNISTRQNNQHENIYTHTHKIPNFLHSMSNCKISLPKLVSP